MIPLRSLILSEKFVASNLVNTQIRCYARWTGRKPVKVYSPDEIEDDVLNLPKKSSKKSLVQDQTAPPLVDEITERNSPKKSQEFVEPFKWRIPKAGESQTRNTVSSNAPKPLTVRKVNKERAAHSVDMLETTIDADGGLIYTKMDNQDKRIAKIFIYITSKNAAEKHSVFLEGKRLIKDAILSNCKLDYILFSRKSDVEDIKEYLPKIGVKLYKVPYKELQSWSDLTTTPGIMGVFKIPDVASYSPKFSLPLTVICDNIREPGNLGAILRTCAGAGCQKVILTKGCVNLWETKVLRSAMGAHFRLQIHDKKDWTDVESMVEDHTIYIADNSTNVEGNMRIQKLELTEDEITNVVENTPLLPYYSVDFVMNNPVAVIVGGETEGVSDKSYKLAFEKKGARLNIPLDNGIDSLNTGTALGVLVFEIKRQLARGASVELLSNKHSD